MTTRDPRRLQFGIRHLLAAMIVVSLVAAIMGPWLRGWSGKQWFAWGCHWGIVLTVFVGWTAVTLVVARRAERRAGNVRFRLSLVHYQVVIWRRIVVDRQRANVAWILIQLFYVGSEVIFFAMINSGKPYWPLLVVFGVGIGMLLSAMFWHKIKPLDEIAVADNGVLWWGGLTPWSNVAFHDATTDVPGWLGMKYGNFEAILMPPEDAMPLIEFLAQRARRWEHPPWTDWFRS
jgi:Na+/melibiose symporter-like transporter